MRPADSPRAAVARPVLVPVCAAGAGTAEVTDRQTRRAVTLTAPQLVRVGGVVYARGLAVGRVGDLDAVTFGPVAVVVWCRTLPGRPATVAA